MRDKAIDTGADIDVANRLTGENLSGDQEALVEIVLGCNTGIAVKFGQARVKRALSRKGKRPSLPPRRR